jgi:uncharacterized protein (TIGR00730 family)
MSKLSSLCVFCGSSPGHDPVFTRTAWAVGELLASRHITLVYGGAQIGLMGSVADAALANGGKVIGVIPKRLMDKELGHGGLSELLVVDSMAQRKERMMELSDAFMALPGSIGTLDELFEVWTATQLGLHTKPCGLLNLNGYFDHLLAFLQRVEQEGFMRAPHRTLLQVADDPLALLGKLEVPGAPVP